MESESSSSENESSSNQPQQTDGPSCPRDVKSSSLCNSLPADAHRESILRLTDPEEKRTGIYPSLPNLSSSPSHERTNRTDMPRKDREEEEEEMAVDYDDDNDDGRNKRVKWSGVPQETLKRLHEFEDKIFYEMATTKKNHTDLSGTSRSSRPHSRTPDSYHVYMPFYERKGSDDRWKIIKRSLYNIKEGRVLNGEELKALILNYNGSYKYKWDFDGLLCFCNEMSADFSHPIDIFRIIPKMADLALNVETIVPAQIPFLTRQQNQSIALSKRQIACLLSHAFFCTYPMRNADPSRDKLFGKSDSLPLPSINFSSLFKFNNPLITKSKLLCILNYFRRVSSNFDPDKKVIFKRQHINPRDMKWKNSPKRFTRLSVATYGHIEKQIGFLQVDFANKYVGGGVIGRGCVQEEIWFLASPELIVARLFTEVLEDNEVLIITGNELYSQYKGYSSSFEWTDDYIDLTRSSNGVKICQMVAMDAKKYYRDYDQFDMHEINRELNKAFCGFHSESKGKDGELPAVATGNWGCGAFSGDKHLKSLIQMMAAAEAGRDVCYFTHGDDELFKKMDDVHRLITSHNLTVGDVHQMINNYVDLVKSRKNFLHETKLYDYILSTFGDDKISRETPV